MKIVVQRPPNFTEIVVALPAAATRHGVLFAYGDILYNPDGVTVNPFLMAHEKMHQVQQAGLPEEWWKLYLCSLEFRLDQELEAHRAEWQAFLAHDPPSTRNARRTYMSRIAHRLASKLYGGLVSVHVAKRLIGGKPPDNAHVRVSPTGNSAWAQ